MRRTPIRKDSRAQRIAVPGSPCADSPLPKGRTATVQYQVVCSGGEQSGYDVSRDACTLEQMFQFIYRCAVMFLTTSGDAAGGGIVGFELPHQQVLHIYVVIEIDCQ